MMFSRWTKKTKEQNHQSIEQPYSDASYVVPEIGMESSNELIEFDSNFIETWNWLVDATSFADVRKDLKPLPEAVFRQVRHLRYRSAADVREFIASSESSLARMASAVDDNFYRLQVPDLDKTGLSAAEHYFVMGWRLGLDPSPGFSSRAYLVDNPDVAAIDLCPLDHYIEHGKKEGRIGIRNYSDFGIGDRDRVYDLIATEFDLDFYLNRYAVPHGIDPVRHYMNIGWRCLFDPNANFSTRDYLLRSPDVRADDEIPFFHFLMAGRREGRAGNMDRNIQWVEYGAIENIIKPEFDVEYYRRKYPDVDRVHADPLMHFCATGWKKGYNPNVNFDCKFYLKLSQDVSVLKENPFFHFINSGRDRGRPGIPASIDIDIIRSAELCKAEDVAALLGEYFDAQFYLAQYDDIALHRLHPLEHYLEHGWREGRDPAPWFSTKDYLSRYPDLVELNINPLLHLVLWGKKEDVIGRRGGGGKPVKKVPGSTTVADLDLTTAKLMDVMKLAPADIVASQQGVLKIGWVVPDFDIGGGGHMTIFRMVRWMELFGHHCTIIVDRPVFQRTNEQRRQLLLAHYQVVKADVVLADPSATCDYDCLIATAWQTAALVATAQGPQRRFYFVQDYEPMFYPVGARSLVAGQTYALDLTCICASRWLKMKMEEHGRSAVGFDLAADEAYWPKPVPRDSDVPRIAFYGRGYTSRRAVELGFMALEVLAQRGVPFVADIFGSHDEIPHAPFDAEHHGVIDAAGLCNLYQNADLGLCFSATNYSLVPQEMMATGLPVVELDTDSTRVAFPDGVVRMAEPNPHRIADVLEALLKDPVEREAQGRRGHEWVSGLSWEKSARIVEQALRGGIPEPVSDGAVAALARNNNGGQPHATVIIPTYNGGDLLRQVIDRVIAQRAPWSFELLLIDSSSSDGTWELIQSYGDQVTAHQIDKGQFQHGRTRNLGVEMARGDFVAFLTQDALPIDEFWLYNLVTTLEVNPTAAGVFGRHIAYDHEPAFVKRDMENHFRNFESYPALVSKFTRFDAWLAGDSGWRRFLHFYSDNNSCLRKSVWRRHPYPEIDYGEDQVWALRIIEAGYAKVYARLATVYHSHSYDEMQTFERSRTEAEFFRLQFGYRDIGARDIRAAINGVNINDLRWGVLHGVAEEEIQERLKLNVYALTGHAAGNVDGVDLGSAF
jgi:glycosyltransferase involved in cell wall biosynthesis